jgi:hypothetical protein
MKSRALILLAAGLFPGLALAGTSGGIVLDGGVLAVGNPGTGGEVQAALGSGTITVNNGAILRLGESRKSGTTSYTIANYIRVNQGTIDSIRGNPHFTSRVTIGPGGATFITHSKGDDMSFDSDVTGAGPVAIDNDSSGTGGDVRFTNDFSLMGTVKLNGKSPGFSGGRLFLGDRDALNQATLDVVAGMRGIDFDLEPKIFSFGGLEGDANIDLKGKIMRVGVLGADLTYSGNLTDSVGGGGLMKSGTGTLTFTGAYFPRTGMSVHFGTLVVTGSIACEVKVGDPREPLAPAVLMGTGTMGNVLLQTPGAVVEPGLPGNATGILTSRNFSMIPGSNLSIRLGGSGSLGYDQIRASGQFSLYGNIEVSLIDGFRPKSGDVFYIMVTSGKAPVLGRFSNLVSNEVSAGGCRFRINYAADGTRMAPDSTTGHDVALIALAGK